MSAELISMDEVGPPATRGAARRADKVATKRDELARAALAALSERGYAATGLREIAANSEYSHGVLHYYFNDKLDLISHCVNLYKRECIASYDDVLDGATDAETLRRRFADRLAETMEHDLPTHKLWYDLRMQAVFEKALVADVDAIDDELEGMVWRIVTRYAELAGGHPILDSTGVYAALDGPFERAVRRRGDAGPETKAVLASQLYALLGALVAH